MLPVPDKQSLTIHSLQSTPDTIASDDETPISSITFGHTETCDAAGPAVRRLVRDAKGKSKAKDE
jgi:hypothetical protein